MQEDCKSRELQANDKGDRTQEDFNTQAHCQLQALPVVQLVRLPGAVGGAAAGAVFSLLRAAG